VVALAEIDGVNAMTPQATGIIIAGALIAAAVTLVPVAIMLTNHWTLVVAAPKVAESAMLLNRWTGDVVVCERPIEEPRRFSQRVMQCGQ
jgi:hypothetical protein